MPETNKQFVDRINKSFEPLPEGVESDWSYEPADTANDLMEAVSRIEDLEALCLAQQNLISSLTGSTGPVRSHEKHDPFKN